MEEEEKSNMERRENKKNWRRAFYLTLTLIDTSAIRLLMLKLSIKRTRKGPNIDCKNYIKQ